jgi:hypothetical protein
MEHGRGSSDRPNEHRAERTRSYIVRLWFERREGAPPALRGTVAELGGETIGAFNSIRELSALMVREIIG